MKTDNSKAKAPYFPRWYHDVVTDFLEEYESLKQLTKMTTGAISLLQLSPEILKELDKKEEINGGKDHFSAGAYRSMETMATIAQQEKENGFPLIRGQAAVGLWAILEATMNNITSGWIYHNKDVLDSEPIAKIKIRIGDYERLTAKDRCDYIVDQIEKDLGSGQKLGISRFESLLCLFYQTEELPANLRKYLYELSQIRNAIVHRAYRADQVLVKSCPWLKIRAGQKLKVTEAMLGRYFDTTGMYMEWTCYCVLRHYGGDVSTLLADLAIKAKDIDDASD